ncbi:MAG: hypothetical protein JOZ12_04345, partial [Sinobacteraceae bacterium]|nr:hypothetical protein [Nevskiaceae bacterium]
LACLSLLGTGVALAGDPGDSSSSDHSQMMKTCMEQQKAQNSGISKQDARKACREQLRMSKASTAPNQATTPNQTTPTTTGDPAPQSGSETNPPTSPPK